MYSLRFKKNIRFRHPVSLALLLKDGRLAFAVENLIFIHNCKNFKCDLIIKGNKNKISILEQLPNGKLITYGREIKLYIISQKKYYCEHTYILSIFEDEYSYILLAPISNEMMAVKTETSLMFFNCKPPFNLIKEVQSEKTAIILYKLQQRNLLFLCCDITFRAYFWDINLYKEIATIKNIGCSLNGCFIETNQKLIVAQSCYTQLENFYIFIINLSSLTIELRIEWNQLKFGQAFNFTEIDDNIFMFSNTKGLYISSPLGYHMKWIKWKNNKIYMITKIKKYQIVTIRKRNATVWIINRHNDSSLLIH